MATIFTSRPGHVTVIKDTAVQGVQAIVPLVDFKNPTMKFDSELCIVNAVAMQESANYQFAHTLGADIYLYVFGDRIGQMVVSGVAFAQLCVAATPPAQPGQPAAAPAAPASNEHGMSRMRRWYHKNKVSARLAPIDIILGNSKDPITGFVLDFSINTLDVASLLTNWRLSLAVVPEKFEDETPAATPATPTTP